MNGAPAFPTLEVHDGQVVGVTPGISMRDYLAAAALPGLIAQSFSPGEPTIVARYAQISYQYADAMMKARSK